MSDLSDDYEALVLDEDDLRVLDAPIDRPLSRGALVPGPDAYAVDYRGRPGVKTESVTGYKPHSWQLDCAVASHLGRDVCVIAGTGFGKTLPFVMNCWMDTRLLVWIVSPLNALGNQQAKTFCGWGIRAIAVNATTNYPGLRKDILSGKFQVVISSIEAFTDTTRLLPVVKSPELASRGRQQFIADEAHCIVGWGKGFRPQYAVMGDLKLVGNGEIPFIAATATANNLMRESIKQVLRFGNNSLTINLGNHRPNLAYSVHRLAHASASVPEILEYFPSRTSFPHFSLIFVDSRALGQAVLHTIRQHVIPSIRWKVQIYHAFRSDLVKEALAFGFELEDGFRVLVCTESLTMGIDFRKVSRVFLMLSPTDIETFIQRSGRGGRDEAITCEVILLAQDSMFEDSVEGRKRLEKSVQKEQSTLEGPGSSKPATLAAALKAEAAKANAVLRAKAKRVTRQYTEAMYTFINTSSCRVEVLDKECDNPPRPEGVCECDFHRHMRGKQSFREQIVNKDKGPELEEVLLEDENNGQDDENNNNNKDNKGDNKPPDNNDKKYDNEEVDMKSEVDVDTAPVGTTFRKSAERKPYVAALKEWRDIKYSSPECIHLNVTKDWVLSPKDINNISRHLNITSLKTLTTLQPPWIHQDRWGDEILDLLADVDAKQAQLREEKQLVQEQKRQATQEKHRVKLGTQEKKESKRKHKIEDAIQAISQMSMTPRKRRAPLPEGSTPEEVEAREREVREERNLKSKTYYWANQGNDVARKRAKFIPNNTISTPKAGSSYLPTISTPASQHIFTFSAKQEVVDEQDRLLGSRSIGGSSRGLPLVIPPPSLFPITPQSPSKIPSFNFQITTPEDAAQQYQQLTPSSQHKGKQKQAIPLDEVETPLASKPRYQPLVKPKLQE